jgi:6-pyruvoyl-tetrahydropterin synthase
VLVEICEPYTNRNFNEVHPFDATNPSAELIARHIAEELASRLDQALAPNARVQSVSITEAPGCVAVYSR